MAGTLDPLLGNTQVTASREVAPLSSRKNVHKRDVLLAQVRGRHACGAGSTLQSIV